MGDDGRVEVLKRHHSAVAAIVAPCGNNLVYTWYVFTAQLVAVKHLLGIASCVLSCSKASYLLVGETVLFLALTFILVL